MNHRRFSARIASAASSGDSCRPCLAGVDRFPRDTETGGKPALSQGELFAECSVFLGAHDSSVARVAIPSANASMSRHIWTVLQAHR